MTDESLELHTAAIYALNLSHTGDLGIHVHVCACGIVLFRCVCTVGMLMAWRWMCALMFLCWTKLKSSSTSMSHFKTHGGKSPSWKTKTTLNVWAHFVFWCHEFTDGRLNTEASSNWNVQKTATILGAILSSNTINLYIITTDQITMWNAKLVACGDKHTKKECLSFQLIVLAALTFGVVSSFSRQLFSAK